MKMKKKKRMRMKRKRRKMPGSIRNRERGRGEEEGRAKTYLNALGAMRGQLGSMIRRVNAGSASIASYHSLPE